jgi:hypothetical protein
MFGQFTITNYQQVSQQVGSASTTYAITAQVNNTGVAVGSVTATATSTNPFNLRIVPSANTLTFGPVAANGNATSINNFSVIIPNGTPFSSSSIASNISWTFTTTPVGPIANAGPSQTATPGQTVTLNGGGSTNPSGSGTLTYLWSFASRPAGSSTVLQNQQNVISSFIVDVPGTFVVQLTVSNGTASSSADVTVSSSTDIIPVANAGTNQTVTTLPATITLNGAGSSDTNGHPLTYLWSLTTIPPGSTATLGSTTAVGPTFVADKDGTYVATLVVNDGVLSSKPSTVTISENTPPVANAGTNQTMVPIGSKVTLNGSGSTDLDGDPLTYQWSLITLPSPNSKAVLSSATLVNPTFVADLPGNYVAQLIVADNLVPSTPVTVQITTNQPLIPVANAGPNQSVAEGTLVSLNGTGSTDPQNFQLTYSWSLTNVPAGSKASLTGATTATPTFLADLAGTYVAQLVVNDGYGSSDPALPGSTVTISSAKQAPQLPIASAGPAQSVAVGATVTLNGSGSSDPQNATPLTYSWSLISAPPNSLAVLKNPTTVSPTFVADMAGAYVAQLIVTDSLTLVSSPATVMITVPSTPPIILQSGVQVSVGGQGTLNVSLPSVPASPVFVNLTISNGSIAAFSGNSTTTNVVVSGTNPTAVKINGIGFGTVTITATANGYQTATTTVVSTDIATFSPNTVTINGETTDRGASFLVLSSAAQSAITFNLSSSNPSVATVPATVTINAGSINANVAVTSVSGGTAVITATASSAAQAIAAATLNVTVNAVEITTTQLPPATIGAPYTQLSGQPVQLTAANGTAPYTWRVAPGSVLPPDLTLSPAGVLGGGADKNSAPSITPVTFIVTDSSSPNQTASATLSVQVVAGIPYKITASTASVSESTADTTAFPTPLSVTVTDVNGYLVPNASVTFTVTANAGASGTFPGASATATVPTNSAGVATAPVLTANGTLGSFTVSASVPPVAAPNPQPTPATFNLTNNVGVPATIAMTSGSPQNTTEQTAFTNPLVVTVKDAGGNPVPSAVVTFSVPPSSGASASFTGGNTATTNPSGVATSNQVIAGPIAGAYAVTAASGSATGASFALTNNVGPAASITVTGAGVGASVAINQNFPALVATVKDSGGNGVPNIPVNFAPTPGTFGQSATFVPNPATTGANGSVTVTATANSFAGPLYSVLASATGGSNPTTTFNLTNVSGPAAKIVVNGGTSPQIVADTTAFAPLFVFVTDLGGNPVNNQAVTFTIGAPVGGASATFAGGALTTTVSTNASGVATTASILTANKVVGGPYTVTAAIQGNASISIPFFLTNKVGPPYAIGVSGTVPPSVPINTAFAPLIVTVTDQGGNPVPNVSVTFTPPSSGASGTFASGNTASTGSNGLATAPTYTANSLAGADTATASIPGTTPLLSTNFVLTNLAGPAATLTVNGGNNQSAGIGTQFTLPLSVLAKDAGGNVVPNAPITFSAPGTGASAGFPTLATTTATTGTNGIATTSVAPTANGTPGVGYSVTATVTGSNPAVSTSFTMTNNPGPPASITPGTGSGQSTTVATAFGQALQVTVKDANGDLLPGITVTFTAVAGTNGASGLFGSSASTTAQTNSSGVATATPTANTKAGTFTVQVTATPGNAPAVTFSLTNTAGSAAAITAAASSTPQSVAISKSFANPLLVTVADQYGNPVSGATVVFGAPSTGASATFSTPAATNSVGQTSVTATAGSIAGTYPVTATISGVTGVSATFTLTNNPGPAANIAITSGNTQQAGVLTAYANPLVVTVTDAGGNTVATGTPVTFTAPATASSATGTFGTFATSAVVTGANGVATSGVITANKIMGTFQVGVTSGSTATLQTPFSLTNIPGPPASIAITGGSPQSAQVTQPFANPLAVTVKDSQGNLVSNNVQVTFTAPAASGTNATGTFSSGSSITVNTVNGVATAPFTAGTVASATAYTVSAIPTTGTATAVSFSLTNTPGPAANIAISSGSPQSMQVNIGGATTSKYGALAVIVKDAQGNLVASGTPVTFTAPSSGPTGLFGTASFLNESTNASGIATVPANTLVAGTVAGTFNLTVTAGTGTLLFPLTNTPGQAAKISATSGGGQTAIVKQAFSNPLVVTVTDANGNFVNNQTVTFTAPAQSGASGTFAGSVNTAATNASGVATSAVFTANGVASPQASPTYNVTASVSGVQTTATFALTNQSGPPASITPVGSTNNQAVAVTQPFAPLAVTVTDVGGNFVSGATVTFTAPTSGASGTFTTVNTAMTNASGVATSTVYTANTVAGVNYTVTAAATGGTNPSTPFTLTNKPGPATQILATSGSGQTPQINAKFTLVATVEDQYGNVVSTPATTVTFSGPTTTAGVVASQAVPTVNGIATVTQLQANLKLGQYTVTASATGTSLTQAMYTITNLVGPVATLTIASGSPQSVMVNTQYAAPLVVTAADLGGNPVPNAPVTFSAPTTSGVASGSFNPSVQALTGTNGQAQVNFIANTVLGNVSVQASTPSSLGQNGVVTLGSNTFALTNLHGPAFSITAQSGGGQTAYLGTEFASPLKVLVQDQYGNAISGQTVIFSNPPSGNAKAVFGDDPGGSTSSAVTNSSGIATSFPVTAGSIPGTYTVTANTSPTAVATAASFSLTNNTVTPPTNTITMTASPGGTLNLGQNMMMEIQVTVTPQPTTGVQLTATTDGVNLMLGQGTAVQTEQFGVPGGTASSVSVDIFVQAMGNLGQFPITFDMPGYKSGTGMVTVVPSGFILANSNDTVPPANSSFSTYVGVPTGLTVYAVQLDSGDNFSSPYTVGTIRGGITSPISVPVSVSGGNPEPGTITAPASFAGGSQLATVTFNATNIGGGTISLPSTPPSGFSTPTAYQTLGVTVGAESIVTPPVTVGNNLETSTTFSLNGVAPSSNCPAGFDLFTVTATSPILLSNTLAGATSSTIQVPVVCGQSLSQPFFVQVVGGTVGQANLSYTVSGQGFPQSSGAITVGKSGFAVADNGSSPYSGQFFRTVATGLPETLTVYSYLLDGSGNPLTQQVLASNYPSAVSIAMISDNTAVGTLASNSVTIAPGVGMTSNTFTGVAGPSQTQLNNGVQYATANVKITPTPSGFTTSSDSTIQADVYDPGFSVQCSGPLGQFLQTGCTVSVGAAVQGNSAMNVQIQATGNILLSTTGTNSGSSAPITVQIQPGSTAAPTFFVYGGGSSGTATVTASDAGGSGVTYSPTTSQPINLVPSGVALVGNFTSFGPELLTSASDISPYNQPPFTVEVGILNANGSFGGPEPLAGNVTATVNLSLSGPGTLGATQVTIPAGQYQTQVSYTPPSSVPSPNTATISLTGTPTGVTGASTQSSLAVVIEQ